MIDLSPRGSTEPMISFRRLAEKFKELWSADDSRHRLGSLLPISLVLTLLTIWLLQ